MTRKNNGGRSPKFHFPRSDFDFTLEEVVEIIDPATNQVNGEMTLRSLLEKFG